MTVAKRFNINSLIEKIVLLALILTPFFNLYELAAISKSEFNQMQAITPIYIKLSKDFFMFLIIVLTFIVIFRRFYLKKLTFFLFFLFLLYFYHVY